MESWHPLPARIPNARLRPAERSTSSPPPLSSGRGCPPARQSRVVPSQGLPAVRASAFPLPRVHRVTIGGAVPVTPMSQLAVWCFENSSLVKFLSHLEAAGRRSVARTHASFERGGQRGVGPIAGEKEMSQA